MSEMLFEEVGPNGNIQAYVESVEGVCFFYLSGSPDTKFGLKSVWVRNFTDAPAELERDRMKEGLPPRNPAQYCRHPKGQPPLRKDSLRVVWLPEGNGAALYEDSDFLAIIPPWSGISGFDGYARDCLGQGPLAWELTPDNVLVNRFAEAQTYWQQWDNEKLWNSIQSSLMTKIETALGSHSNYYAIDGGKWPPKAIVRIPRNDGVMLVSLGISSRPQPNVEMHTEQPEQYRRIEFGVLLPKQWADEDIKKFASYLSGQSSLPWTHYTWLGAGHTIPCDSWRNPKYTSALLVTDHAGVPPLNLGTQFGDPVTLLWFLPITAQELKLAKDKGSEPLRKSLPPKRWCEA